MSDSPFFAEVLFPIFIFLVGLIMGLTFHKGK